MAKIDSRPEALMSAEEISERYNGGKRVLDFTGKKKIFFGVSLGIIVIGSKEFFCN